MASFSNNKKRKEKDVMKLIMSEYEVTLKDESKMDEFSVVFYGPKDSPYEQGAWKVNVLLPDQYPYKSPSIGFENKIYHPNIDESSGSVCLDVINQTWSPMYELKNIFDVFLPQLLMYPNPSDPLNSSAAKLLLLDNKKYEETIREHVLKHAKNTKFISSSSLPNNNNNNNSSTNNNVGNPNKSDTKENRNLSGNNFNSNNLINNKLSTTKPNSSTIKGKSLFNNNNNEDRVSEISAASLEEELSEF